MHRYGKSVRFTARTLVNAVFVGASFHNSFFDYKGTSYVLLYRHCKAISYPAASVQPDRDLHQYE